MSKSPAALEEGHIYIYKAVCGDDADWHRGHRVPTFTCTKATSIALCLLQPAGMLNTFFALADNW